MSSPSDMYWVLEMSWANAIENLGGPALGVAADQDNNFPGSHPHQSGAIIPVHDEYSNLPSLDGENNETANAQTGTGYDANVPQSSVPTFLLFHGPPITIVSSGIYNFATTDTPLSLQYLQEQLKGLQGKICLTGAYIAHLDVLIWKQKANLIKGSPSSSLNHPGSPYIPIPLQQELQQMEQLVTTLEDVIIKHVACAAALGVHPDTPIQQLEAKSLAQAQKMRADAYQHAWNLMDDVANLEELMEAAWGIEGSPLMDEGDEYPDAAMLPSVYGFIGAPPIGPYVPGIWPSYSHVRSRTWSIDDIMESLSEVSISSIAAEDNKCPHCWLPFGVTYEDEYPHMPLSDDPVIAGNLERFRALPYDESRPDNDPVRTPCGHIFGRSCLAESLRSSVVCPMCRASLEPDIFWGLAI